MGKKYNEADTLHKVSFGGPGHPQKIPRVFHVRQSAIFDIQDGGRQIYLFTIYRLLDDPSSRFQWSNIHSRG